MFKVKTPTNDMIDSKECEILNFKGEFVIDVKDLHAFINKNDDGSFNDDDSLIISAVSVAIGTTRGIIYTRTSGTFLQKYYLPPNVITNLLNRHPHKAPRTILKIPKHLDYLFRAY